jgi:hypothetical protein
MFFDHHTPFNAPIIYWPLTRVSLELSCCPSPRQETSYWPAILRELHESTHARATDGGSHSITRIPVATLSAIWGSHSGDWSLLSNGMWRRVIEVSRRCSGTYCLHHNRYHSPSWWRHYVLPKRRYISSSYTTWPSRKQQSSCVHYLYCLYSQCSKL